MNERTDHGDDRSARGATPCVGVSAELVAFDRDELGVADAAAVRSHLASCASCAAELRRVRHTIEIVARATDVAPTAAGSARLRARLDAALAESAADSTHNAAAESASHRPLLSLWGRARARYEESASFRRFTLTSLGLHAAAAVLLAVVLARSSDTLDRPAVIHIEPGETAITWPNRPADGHPERTARLAPFDAATLDGVAAPGTSSAVFPNATTAARWGATAAPETRRVALRVALGDDAGADRAQIALDRGLAWLALQRGADGSLGAPAERLRATSAAILAFAGQGRTTVDDAQLALSVDWLERAADSHAAGDTAVEDDALALRALTAQLVSDYAGIGRAERRRRSTVVASLAERLEASAARRADTSAAPRARLDAAASVSVVAALADVRTAGLRDTSEALSSLVRRLDAMRSPDGHLTGRGQSEGVVLTAALAEVASDVGARPLAGPLVASLNARICTLAASSTQDAARGAAALAALGHPVREPIRAALASQRPDGSWAPAQRTTPPVSTIVETAYGVVTVTRAYRR